MSATDPVHWQSNAQESAVEDYVVSFRENSRRLGTFGELQGKFEAYVPANLIIDSMKGQNGYTA
jgi:hypothetical protein